MSGRVRRDIRRRALLSLHGLILSLVLLPPSKAGDGRPRHHDHWCGSSSLSSSSSSLWFAASSLPWRETRSANRRRCRSNGGAGMASKEKKRGSKEGNKAFDARVLHPHHVFGTQSQHQQGGCMSSGQEMCTRKSMFIASPREVKSASRTPSFGSRVSPP